MVSGLRVKTMWLSMVSMHKIKVYIHTKDSVDESNVRGHLPNDTRATLHAGTEATQAKAGTTAHLSHGREREDGRPL